MQQNIIDAFAAAESQRLRRADLITALRIDTNDRLQLRAFAEAEQALVDAKRIERRRGRGGGIFLLPDATTAGQAGPVAIPEEGRRENEYYIPLLDQILQNWAQQPGYTHVFGEVIANQGRRDTGGRWSRPDLVLLTVSDWVFTSRPEGDVRTIEVKKFDALDVTAVYEALSHRSRAHFSYLLIVDYPQDPTIEQIASLEPVLAAATQHGVGIITATDEHDWNSWEFEIDARRSDSDPQAINDMLINGGVSVDIRNKFRTALRTIQIEF